MAEAIEKRGNYTYDDYASWGEEVRYELIDGVVYDMASPNDAHQRIHWELIWQLGGFLRGKPCQLRYAPFDVLPDVNSKKTVVVPDIFVVCDTSKLSNGKYCLGPPDLIIEILSFSSKKVTQRDTLEKLRLYQRTGVREYWIVNPDSSTVNVHVLENGKYFTTAYGENDTISVHVVEGCQITLSDVFADVEYENNEG